MSMQPDLISIPSTFVSSSAANTTVSADQLMTVVSNQIGLLQFMSGIAGTLFTLVFIGIGYLIWKNNQLKEKAENEVIDITNKAKYASDSMEALSTMVGAAGELLEAMQKMVSSTSKLSEKLSSMVETAETEISTINKTSQSDEKKLLEIESVLDQIKKEIDDDKRQKEIELQAAIRALNKLRPIDQSKLRSTRMNIFREKDSYPIGTTNSLNSNKEKK